jgi:hypothetical protein
MRSQFILGLAVAFLTFSAPAQAGEILIEDNFAGVETLMADGKAKLYPDPRIWAFTFWPGVKWPDS